MKLSLIAVAAALLLAFCTKDHEQHTRSASWPFNWYVYQDSTYAHQFDEDYYVLDDDQYPSCMNFTGNIRCEVKCMGDAWIEGRPDFSTIQAIRYRPL